MWVVPTILLLAVTQVEVTVKSLDNSQQAGRLVALDAQHVVIETDGNKQTLLLDELVGITPTEQPAESTAKPAVWVELTDGSKLVAEDYVVANGRAKSELLGGGSLNAKTSAIHWARFKPQTPEQAAEWAKVVAEDATGDLIVIRKNDRIDFLEGVVEDITATTVNFRLDGDLVPVRREKVEGVVYFNPATARAATPAGIVHDAAGSHVKAVKMSLSEDGLQLTTSAGVTLTRPLAVIRRIDFSAGKIQYLSTIEPRSIEWTPFFGSAENNKHLAGLYQPRMSHPGTNNPARTDQSVLQLRATNNDGVSEIRSYERGISIHSRTKIVWQLPDEFSQLKAIVGIDAQYRNLGDVELIIEGDGKELFRGPISGQDEPLPLDLDIAGVRRLSIVVDFGKNLDLGDHLNLCNIRVVK